jgi:serine/threonine protein kinase
MRDFFRASDGSYILVMQFIEGKELQKTIEKHNALEPETICWITQRLLNALYYLHHSGIIHGDVKPGNVIVQPATHNAVLVDYGLASIRPKSDSRALGCTELFAAPEITADKPPIPESDIYSLGLTMLYACGGDPIAKTFPKDVPQKLQDYFGEFIRYNPADRPNWEKDDLVSRLSDLRQELFGRRSTL